MWVAMKFGSHGPQNLSDFGGPLASFPALQNVDSLDFKWNIHGPQWMNPNDFGDPLTFTPTPPAGWHFLVQVKYIDKYWMDCH